MLTIYPKDANFEASLATWFEAAQKLITDHYAKDGWGPKEQGGNGLEIPTLEKSYGNRYVRIIRKDKTNDKYGAAHAFIDITNGDVLKPANYKTPAKHARGNIFDEHNGLSWMTWTGPAYLR